MWFAFAVGVIVGGLVGAFLAAWACRREDEKERKRRNNQ